MPLPCNCDDGECPVEGRCKVKGVIYQASVHTQNQETFKYIGLTEKELIQQIQKHNSSFRRHDPRNSTSLSKKVLELQRNHVLFEVKWKILEVASPYSAGRSQCRLCNTEIYYILFKPDDSNLNSRQELSNKCRHQNKLKLRNG